MNNLTNALLITALGMGLVFLSLIVLWGLMALIIRIFPEREETGEEGAAEPEEAAAPGEIPVPIAEAEAIPSRKRRAAAIAVALALQLAGGPTAAKSSDATLQPPPVSAWQSVMRSNMLNKRGLKR